MYDSTVNSGYYWLKVDSSLDQRQVHWPVHSLHVSGSFPAFWFQKSGKHPGNEADPQ